jgi:TIM-barrel protein
VFEPRVALASLSGVADAVWASDGAPVAGAAFLGGIALDEPSREAARDLVARGREEFLPAAPVDWIDEQLSALQSTPIQPGVNVRAATAEPIADAAAVCARHDAIVEINAHCRQPELCAAGCGQSLLCETDRLRSYVETAANTGATVSVKLRAEVDGVDLPALAEVIDEAGARYCHVDAMDSEPIIADVASATDGMVIANNEVRDRRSVREYLSYGADAVSIGRPSDDPRVLERVRESTEEWFAEQRLTA